MRENAIRFLSLLLCAALLISPMAGMAVSAAETENHATVTEADAEQDPSKAANPGESGTPEEPAAPVPSSASRSAARFPHSPAPK